LADYYTRIGRFIKARKVFEEALSKLTSVRDFGIIYNAYLKFEEAMLEVDEESDEDETPNED
jgi:pre-mRNA-splicing factor SYF1